MLPLHEARVEMETEMTWASDGERAAPFTLLRPLLLMHFDAVLPIFLLCAHNDDVVHAALFEAALFQPLDADAAETCAAVRYLKMAAAALDAPPADELSAVHVSAAEMDASLNDNAAAVLFWAFLFLVAPERTFRRDALGVIYAMLHEFGLKLGEYETDKRWPKKKEVEAVVAAPCEGLDIFWFFTPFDQLAATGEGLGLPPSPTPSNRSPSPSRRPSMRSPPKSPPKSPSRRRSSTDAVAAAEPARRHEPRARAARERREPRAPPQLVEPRAADVDVAARAAELVGLAGVVGAAALALAVALVGERGGRDRSHTEQELARPVHQMVAARLVGAGGFGSGASADLSSRSRC